MTNPLPANTVKRHLTKFYPVPWTIAEYPGGCQVHDAYDNHILTIINGNVGGSQAASNAIAMMIVNRANRTPDMEAEEFLNVCGMCGGDGGYECTDCEGAGCDYCDKMGHVECANCGGLGHA